MLKTAMLELAIILKTAGPEEVFGIATNSDIIIAMPIPVIPKRLPRSAEEGEDRPLRESMNSITTGIIAKMLRSASEHIIRSESINLSYLLFFENMASIRFVKKKPPKILIEAKKTATRPKKYDFVQKELGRKLRSTTRMAATITTLEMAFVTDIKGACSAGVTFNTT
jgi:hypothetical protein